MAGAWGSRKPGVRASIRVKSQAEGESWRQNQETGQGSIPGIGVHVWIPGVSQESESMSESRSIMGIQEQGSWAVAAAAATSWGPNCCLNTSWYILWVYIETRSQSGITKATVGQVTQGRTSCGIEPLRIVGHWECAGYSCHWVAVWGW